MNLAAVRNRLPDYPFLSGYPGPDYFRGLRFMRPEEAWEHIKLLGSSLDKAIEELQSRDPQVEWSLKSRGMLFTEILLQREEIEEQDDEIRRQRDIIQEQEEAIERGVVVPDRFRRFLFMEAGASVHDLPSPITEDEDDSRVAQSEAEAEADVFV